MDGGRGRIAGVIAGASARGYTGGMKVAVSIPDPIFARADALASQLGTSRSELYRRALDRYLADHDGGSVTERMNAALADAGPEDPREIAWRNRAAYEVFARTEWK